MSENDSDFYWEAYNRIRRKSDESIDIQIRDSDHAIYLMKTLKDQEREIKELLDTIEEVGDEIGKIQAGNVSHRKASIQSVCNLQRIRVRKKLGGGYERK